MSISETAGAIDEPGLNKSEGECINVEVAMANEEEGQVVGIGVVAADSNCQEKAVWAMREECWTLPT